MLSVTVGARKKRGRKCMNQLHAKAARQELQSPCARKLQTMKEEERCISDRARGLLYLRVSSSVIEFIHFFFLVLSFLRDSHFVTRPKSHREGRGAENWWERRKDHTQPAENRKTSQLCTCHSLDNHRRDTRIRNASPPTQANNAARAPKSNPPTRA